MKQFLRLGTLTVLLGVSSSVLADSASTLGGLVIKSDDGNFVGSLGGRIQFDYSAISRDSSAFDSGVSPNDSGFYFRRVFISLSGQIYGWRYRIDEDISNTTSPASGFNDVYVAHDLWGYGNVRIGQTKPWRSLDELTPNSDILFTNRDAVSAVGLLGGRDFQQGVFYKDSIKHAFLPSDNLWVGAAGYSLNKAGGVINEGTSTTSGLKSGEGYNARIAYAPLVTNKEWLHVGANYSFDQAANGTALTAYSSDWYSYKGITQTLATLHGAAISATNIQSSDNPSAQTEIGELAGAFGPAFLQGEYGQTKLKQSTATSATTPDKEKVEAITIQGSVYLTGETRTYDTVVAATRMTTPIHSFGAIELAARYDFLKNKDLPSGDTTVCAPAVGKIPTGTTITECEIQTITFGVNYYINNAVRLTLDYDIAKFDLGNAGEDKPNALNARFQLVF